MKRANKHLRGLSFVILVLVMTLTLAACGGSNASSSRDTVFPSGSASSASQSSVQSSPGGSTASESGEELTDFSNEFLETLGTTSGRFEPALNGSDISLNAHMDLINAAMPIASVATYDLVGNPFAGGLTDQGGYREVSGSVITFGMDYVRKQEGGYGSDQLAGDREVVEGKVDLSAGTVIYETRTERDGKLIRRTVTEGVMLPDGSVMLQWLNVGVTASGMDPAGMAVFITSSADNLVVLGGNFEYDPDFSYTSILGKSALSAEDMAADYELLWKIISDLEKASSERY